MKQLVAYGVIALLTAVTTPVMAQSAPTDQECEVNKVAAEKAAQTAVDNQHLIAKAIVGTAVGGTCAGLFFAFGGTDLGITGATCAVVTTLAVVGTSTPANAATIAGEAYAATRNPACLVHSAAATK